MNFPSFSHSADRLRASAFVLLVLTTGCAWLRGAEGDPDRARLADGFVRPPAAAKPGTWWHWMDGNISRQGITADLEAMKRVGLAGADIFIGDADMPRGPVDFMSPAFHDMISHAAREAGRLGLELGFHNCAGWSSSGGPWITPGQSMKTIVSRSIRVRGPVRFKGVVPHAYANLGFYRDIAVQAFRTTRGERVRMREFSPKITATGHANGSALADGDEATQLQLPTPNAKRPPVIQIEFAEPFLARQLAITAGRDMEGVTADFLVSDDGSDFRKLFTLSLPVGSATQYFAFAPTRARYFRIAFTSRNPRTKQLAIAEVDLSQQAGVSNLGGKAFFDRKGDYTLDRTQLAVEELVDPEAIVDLTAGLNAAGELEWDVPPGDWTILRTGYTAIGVKNHPAPPEGTGLECDKLNASAVDAHWAGMMAKMVRDFGDLAPQVLKEVLIDSYEVSTQNWTEGFREEFRQRRGFDPVPYLPVLSGRFVGSADRTERFLWDLRRTISDLFAQNYAGRMAELARRNGMRLALEPYGNCPSDDLQYGAAADVPMSEFWLVKGLDGCTRLAASIGHTMGKPIIAAESFTAGELGGNKWNTDPYALKALGDLLYTGGINRFVLHQYTHQPLMDRAPGLTLGGVGTHFGRLNTWWEQGAAWIGYLSRCQWLLQQGKFVADVLYYEGEDLPLGKYGGGLQVALPEGYQSDACSASVLVQRVAVREGRLALPDGMTYRLLVLPRQPSMSVAVARKLRELVRAGARVVGPRPSRTPGLTGYPGSEAELQQITDELWGGGRIVDRKPEDVLREMAIGPDFTAGAPGIAYIHRRVAGADAYFVSNQTQRPLSCEASFRVVDGTPEFWHPDSGAIELAAVYRTVEGMTQLPLRLDPSGSVFVVFHRGRTGEHLVSVRASSSDYAVQAHAAGGWTVDNWGAGSMTLETSTGRQITLEPPAQPAVLTVEGPWNLEFPPNLGAPARAVMPDLRSWTENVDEGIKYFSGTAAYTKEIDIPESWLRDGRTLLLDLGVVRNLARVVLNGHDLGVLWKPPFSIDLTRSAAAGRNRLRIEVTNLWPNRLIGDERLPDDHRWNGQKMSEWPAWFLAGQPSPTGRVTFATRRHWQKGDELLPSGLLGPVTVRVTERQFIKP